MTYNVRTIAAAIITLLLTIQAPLHAGNAIPSPTPKDKCAVCGMFVGKYQNWLAIIRLKNGSIAYFDGPKDMFTYYLNPGKYQPAAKSSEVVEIMIKDYYSLKPIDARTAYFVAGSNVTGPMGNELIPLAKKSDAQEFLTDHKGKKIYRFNEITLATLKSLE
jgi:nitrous oxide reductase accessory protein NosL